MLLEFQNLGKTYGQTEALKNLNLRLPPGIYGLLGPNGAGKSTLMKLICMLLEPSKGAVLFDGRDIRTQKRAFLKQLGYMPQQSCLYPEFRVLEYLYYTGALKGMEKKKLRDAAHRLLERMRLLDVAGQKIRTLSGGMRQRLMFAQVMLDDPLVVILDEPTAGLDPKKRIEMRNLIASCAKDKIFLIATHVVTDVEMIADQILLLDHGRLLAAGTAVELTSRLHGRVFETRLTDPLETLEARYQVSSLFHRGNLTCAKLLVRESAGPPPDAVMTEPDLEDVYLWYFGEEA